MNIIICDDSQNDRKILIELLQSYAQEKKQCFEMIEYDSGASLCEDESALQKCQLVFLDINMEDMDGLKAAMKIKEEYPKLPVVLVTAYMNYALDGYKVKASRFLLKDNLAETIGECMDDLIVEIQKNSRILEFELVDVVVSGSRCRGLEKAGSDLDVVVEYKGREHEDDLFNAFNEDGLMIGGIKVDINPITEGRTGTLATYLPGVESYLAEKQAMQKASALEAISEKTVTLTVAECGEFHSLGEFHENIASVEEAIAVWKSIPPERMNGIPSIGINIHTEGTERYEDVEMDILSGKVIDLEVLDYVPDITDDPKAIEVIAELIDKLPDIEVRGSLEKWQAAILASQIDQFSYDYDTYQYRDTVEDREAQVANITEDIRNGNTGYLNDFLNAVISEGVREGITDIFGQGVEIDDSEAVQTARRAKELLDKLAEYKPLAKVEELTEQNYNMIDNVLNNGAEKKEQEQTKGRISIKEKLAEKRAVIEQRDKTERTSPEKETEKKSQREM